MDVLSATSYDDKIAWFENNGSQSFTAHTIATNSIASDTRSVHAADVDSDGDMDVLSASHGGGVNWYENNGSQSFTARTITTAGDQTVDVFAVDLDRDGDVDVYVDVDGDGDVDVEVAVDLDVGVEFRNLAVCRSHAHGRRHARTDAATHAPTHARTYAPTHPRARTHPGAPSPRAPGAIAGNGFGAVLQILQSCFRNKFTKNRGTQSIRPAGDKR